MNQDTLQHQLWEFANDLRGKVPANEYLKKWLLDTDDHRARWKRLDAWLRSVDAAFRTFGATRGDPGSDDIKSACRLICPVNRRVEFAGWDTEYVRSTTQVLDSDGSTTALGAPFGPRSNLDDTVSSCVTRSLLFARPSLTSITPPRNWFSPGSALTFPSSFITCGSTAIALIPLLSAALIATFAQQLKLRSGETYQTRRGYR